MQLGSRDDAITRFEQARSTASIAGDVVAFELVGLTRTLVLGEDSYHDAGHLRPGWKKVAESLAAVAVHLPQDPVS
jgi:hypothetical protein